LTSKYSVNNLLFVVSVGLVAAVINSFRLPLFFESEFVFGQFLVLLVAVYRGPIMGVVASSLASLPLVIAWGSFWSTLTFGLEAVFIGIVCKTNRSNIVLAVMAYWLFIGMPVSWFSISQYESIVDSHRTSILIKQLINGILYAHLAALLFRLPLIKKLFSVSKSVPALSIKQQASHLISSLLITLGILFFFYNLHQNINNSAENFKYSHATKHSELKHQISLIMGENLNAISELKYSLANSWNDEEKRAESLIAFNQRHPSFKTMLLANNAGDLVNSSPTDLMQNANEQKGSRVNVADRDYFKNAINNKGIYVSTGFVGRGFGEDLIVAVSTAIPDQAGGIIGVVEGSFILTSMGSLKLAINNIADSVDAVLIDQDNKILMASDNLNLNTLSIFKYKKGVDNFYKHELVNLVNDQGELSQEVFHFIESVFDWNWKLITLQNEGILATVIERTLIAFAVSIVLVVLISQLFAKIFSHSWSYHMERLVYLIDQGEDFKEELDEFAENDDLPEEINKLYQEIKRSRLKILNMNQTLQNTVAERTEKLQTLNTKLNKMARQDALTQLNNRRVFNDSLNELWIECQRELIPLSMLIIDVDYFKKVNDSYGHPVGDQVLSYLGHELSQFNAGGVKCIARLGGEEFSLLIKGKGHEHAIALAETIRAHVAGLSISIGAKKSINVTISVGVASIDATKFTASKLYQLADNALYEAKHSGRNAVKDLVLL